LRALSALIGDALISRYPSIK